MKNIFVSPAFSIAVTLACYFFALKLHKRTMLFFLHPILVSIALLITLLTIFHVEYEQYEEGSRMLSYLLKPAVVALGVPLFRQLEKIKKQVLLIVISQLVGCVFGIISVVLTAWLMGATREVIFSIAPKSVTTPIAMEVSREIGGIPSLTACIVIIAGILGASSGYVIMKLFRIDNPIAQGLSMGTAAHAIGTAKSMDISPTFGAFSSLGLIINGILTALLAPYILRLLAIWIPL
ncbi:LrgB family protein [Olivibacter sp. SDN3]|uniref:LrgB family protein n=1 Tax=Olivibacter sp. SDN3 TaxID=2764720 RepID=UPI0016516D71|nr:LrgB family protein [Olivibacter sp. SDN3]QNL49767.1 LrgB family protein [Olivibacter sp. SDN3]